MTCLNEKIKTEITEAAVKQAGMLDKEAALVERRAKRHTLQPQQERDNATTSNQQRAGNPVYQASKSSSSRQNPAGRHKKPGGIRPLDRQPTTPQSDRGGHQRKHAPDISSLANEPNRRTSPRSLDRDKQNKTRAQQKPMSPERRAPNLTASANIINSLPVAV